jgi:hypothetical protein
MYQDYAIVGAYNDDVTYTNDGSAYNNFDGLVKSQKMKFYFM